MKIVIEDKFLKIIDKEILRSGNVNSYKMSIEYDSFYNDRVLMIYFKQDDIKKIVTVGPDNIIDIPHEVLENVRDVCVGFYSPSPDGDKLKDRYCSNFDRLTVIEGAYDKDAAPSEELTPTILEKYLQEMKNFYNESIEDYNTNATNKIEEFNKNYEDKIKSYNDNSIQKTNEYNKNADEKIKEINNKVSDVEKIEDNIEEIEKRVSASEQNAKTSEINAKTSEQSAQNSAKKASEIETNIISIQQDINASKTHIDSQKESIDKSAENVKKLVDEATNQANISKKQAEISTTNATQTSADKSAVETMRNEVSSMKTSIEQIKTDTQAIKDDVETAKNETLEAKEEVENSLENERIESDKKYARAIDSEIIEINNYGQVECDYDGYMKDIEIESALPEIVQDVREGYNKFNIDTITENKYIYANNSNTDPYYGKLNNSNSSNTSDYIPVSENTNYLLTYDYDTLLSDNERGYCFYDENKAPIVIDSIVNTLYSVTNKKATFIAPTSAKYLRFSYDKNCNNIQLIEGTEEKPYEEYGASPSLDFPSEFKNILSSFNIKNTVNEIEKYNKQIVLPENNFLGTFNSYKNCIKDNKLKSNLKIVEFDGSEVGWSYNQSENKFMLAIETDIKDSSLPQLCTHFKTQSSWAQNQNEFSFSTNNARFHNDNNMSLEEWKAFLTQQKEAGTPLQILYVSSEEETLLENINLLLYKGINNISAEDLKVSFKYNISIEKYIENNNITERKISDNKYARALKTQVEDIEQIQVYAENDEVENLTIKGAPLTQKTREGYNLLSTENLQELNEKGITLTKENGIISINGQSTSANFIDDYFVGSSSSYEEFLSAGTYLISGITGEALSPNFGILVVIKHLDGSTTNIMQNSESKVFNVIDGDTFRIFIRIPQNLQLNDIVIKPMIVSGTENKDFEEYGASPSLDYPSEVEITKEQKISIFRKNILDTNNINALGKIVVSSKIDGGLNVSGVAAANYKTLSTINLDIPIKAGTSLFSAFGKTLDLLKDNTDITPYFWLYNKNGTNFYTIRGSSKVILTQDVYKITWGIENFILEKEYNEDIYIELEISDKQPTQFQKYENIDINVAIENGAIGKSFDIINKETNFQNKVIKEVIFSGDENWGMNYGVSMFGLEFSEIDFNTDNKIAFCNYFKFNEVNSGIYNTLKDNEFALQLSQGFKKIFFKSLKYTTKAEWKAKLKELYEAGTPVKIYYVSEISTPIPLSEEIKLELNKFKLYNDLNNVFIDKGRLSFKYNKSLSKELEEKDEIIDNLLTRVQALEQAQVNQVGGN